MDITGMEDLEEKVRREWDSGELGLVYQEAKDMQTEKLHPGVLYSIFVYHCVQFLGDGVQVLRISLPAGWIQLVDVLCDRRSSAYMVRVALDMLSNEFFCE